MEPAVAAAGRSQVTFYDKPGVCIGFAATQIQLRNREHDAVEPVNGKAKAQHLLRHGRAHSFSPVGFLPNEDEVLARLVSGGKVLEARVANQRVGLL